MAYVIIKQDCAEDNHLSIDRMCECLSVSRSSYYEWDNRIQLPDQQDPYEMDIRNEIQKIAIEFPCYGYRRVTMELRRRDYKTNHKHVLRIMEADNLLCIKKKFPNSRILRDYVCVFP